MVLSVCSVVYIDEFGMSDLLAYLECYDLMPARWSERGKYCHVMIVVFTPSGKRPAES